MNFPQKKLRICLISNEYPPETGFGGIGTYTYNLAQGFSDKGHDVTVISSAAPEEKEYLDRKVKVYRIKNRKLPLKGVGRIANLLTGHGFGYWWHSQSVFIKIKELMAKNGLFDVIEGPLWDGECVAYSPSIGVPLVVRLQTPIFKSRQILDLPPQKKLEDIEKKSLEKATLIAAISKNIGSLIAKNYGIDNDKIMYSPLGVNLPKIKSSKFIENSFKLLYVGRLEKRKGSDEFIQAIPAILTQNSKITIDIVGKDIWQAPGKISYKEYFDRTVPDSLRKRVKFCGFVDGEKLKDFYLNCDVFIAPSRYESFGLIFLEAMSYGKPVIGTKVGGIPEIVNNGQTGILVDVNNSKQIADAVIRIFKNPNQRKKMGEKARQSVEKYFTINKMVEKTQDIYLQAIDLYKNK